MNADRFLDSAGNASSLYSVFASAEFRIASCLRFHGNRHSHRRRLGGGFKSRAATKELLPPSEASWISQEQLVVIAPAVSQTPGCCKNSLVVSFSWLSHCGRSSLAHWLTVSHECEEPFGPGGCSSGTDPNKSKYFCFVKIFFSYCCYLMRYC